MTTLRILAVDDEPLAIDRLQGFIADIDGIEMVGRAHTAAAASAAIAELKPDLVLLDIQMPGKSGMALAADLPPEDRPEIIFVTAFEQFAPDAFEVDAADYLLKPVRFDRLRQAVTRARRRIDLAAMASSAPAKPDPKYAQEIWVPTRDGQVRVGVDQIDWIEAAKDYVIFHTATRGYLHRISMSALEAKLDPAALLRVHRSAFVRPALVERVERPGKGAVNLVLRDGAIVQVGPSYVKDVTARITGAGE